MSDKMEAVPMEEKKVNGFYKWEIESAARTLTEAMRLANKPKLLKLARAELKRQQTATDKAVNWASNL